MSCWVWNVLVACCFHLPHQHTHLCSLSDISRLSTLQGADHYAVDRQLYAEGRWDCLYHNFWPLLFLFSIFLFVSFYWACIMLKPVCVMVEPLSLLYPAWSSQSCSYSFNKIHPGTELKTNKQPWPLVVLWVLQFLTLLQSSCRQRPQAHVAEDMANLTSYEETASSVCVCFSRKMCHRVQLSGLSVVVDDSEFISTHAM